MYGNGAAGTLAATALPVTGAVFGTGTMLVAAAITGAGVVAVWFNKRRHKVEDTVEVPV